MKNSLKLIGVVLGLTYFGASAAYSADTRVTWHGHAAFEITTPSGKVILIDPWLKNPMNPAAKDGKNPVDALKKVDYILVTHGHSDHVGDSVEIAKKTGARLVTNFELGNNMARVIGYPDKQMGIDSLMNIGGEIPLGTDGEVTVAMTPAVHSSGLDDPNSTKPMAYGGNPSGFVLKIKNGPTIYHSGDTAYFKDMELIGDTYAPDLALINIGAHFDMTVDMAAKAAKAVQAKRVVPQHYKTFPILTQDAKGFVTSVAKYHIPTSVLEPGASLVYSGKTLKK